MGLEYNIFMLKKNFQLNITTKDLGDGEIELIIATDSLDRHGERLNIEGLNTKKYMKNPVVQWAHDYTQPPIGRAIKLWKESGKLFGRMKFAISENPLAKTVYDLVKSKFINAASIGFMPIEIEDNVYVKSEMVEFSIVPVPANPEALILARKLGLDTNILKSYNYANVYELKDILKKEVDDLTIGEIAFLKENVAKLTKKQVSKFSSVLKDEPVAPVEPAEPAEPKGDEPVVPTAPAEPKDDEDKEELEDKVDALTKKVAELEKVDPVIVKNISIHRTKDEVSGDEVSKELKFLYYVQGIQSKNFSKYLEVVGKDAMNTSDESSVLPPQEFVTEITRLEEEFGVARRFATMRRSSSGAGIRFLMGADDVVIFDTAESGKKKSTDLSYTEQTLLWRKFAAILPITDELTEDAAIDLWNDATQRFARAYSRREDQLVFTEAATGGNTKDGIVNVTGVNNVEVASPTATTFDDFVDMILGVPSMSGNTGQFYLNRTMLAIAMKLKDDENRPLWLPAIASAAPATILGRPYIETEVLAKIDEADPGVGIAVYGDLKYATLGERDTLKVEMFNTGIVGDPDEVDQDTNTINLLTQDAQAMRVVKRMNAICRFPAAFSVLRIAGGS